MNYLIDGDVAQRILDYLITKPYKEVYDLVPNLIGMTPAEDNEVEEEE